MKKTYYYIISLCIVLITACNSQKSKVSVEDYQQAEKFFRNNLENKLYNLYTDAKWFEDSTGFWYKRTYKNGKEFIKVDFDSLKKEAAFDHIRLADSLSAKCDTLFKKDSLPFNSFKYTDNKNEIEFKLGDSTWIANMDDYSLSLKEKKEKKKPNWFQAFSPDSQWIAYTENYNLYIKSAIGGKKIQLSKNGKENYEYAMYQGWYDIMKGENAKKPKHFRVSWSSDSKKIYTQIADFRDAKKLYLLKTPVDSNFRFELLSYYRSLPGEEEGVKYIPVVFDIEKKKEIIIDIKPRISVVSPYLRWTEDGKKLYGTLWERGYKKSHAIEVNPSNGKVRKVFSDENETYIESQISHFRFIEEKQKAIITSERSGWNHMYLFDWKTGKLINQITDGEFVVYSIDYIDKEKEIIYFTGVGKEEGVNPYYNMLYRVNFDGSDMTLLTPENAHHSYKFSPDKKYFTDNFSRVDMPNKSVLRDISSGKIVMDLEDANVDYLSELNWQAPEKFSVEVDSGRTTVHGVMWKPTFMKKWKKYPIIDHCYTGPQASIAPESFYRALFSSSQQFAELGFIVIMVDGRGTALRSKEFHDFSYKNLGKGVVDHVTVIRKLGERHSFIDTNRVGIFGHSAGGYDAAHALLLYPDFYKVGVAAAGNHDQRMAKAWWPEMYMGYPTESQYEEQSNITMAPNLKGRLFLVHGGIDDNVNPSATYKLATALIKAGKDFDMLILPNSRHGFTKVDNKFYTVKRWNYFLEHLAGREPIRGYTYSYDKNKK